MPSASQPLTSLQIGGSGTVSQINLPPEHCRRLQEMGLLIGTHLQLIRFAPLGDPLEI